MPTENPAQVAVQPAPGGTLPLSPEKREAVQQTSALIMWTLLAVVLVGTVVLVVLVRSRRRMFDGAGAQRPRRKPKTRLDPWAESAKRMKADGEAGPDDDTVDIDPEDLGPGDVKGPRHNGGGGHRR